MNKLLGGRLPFVPLIWQQSVVAWIKSMLSIFCLKHVIEYNSFEAANINISEVIHRLPITNYVTFLHWLQCRLPKQWGYRHCKYQDGRSTSVMSDILGAYYWRWYRMNMALCCKSRSVLPPSHLRRYRLVSWDVYSAINSRIRQSGTIVSSWRVHLSAKASRQELFAVLLSCIGGPLD